MITYIVAFIFYTLAMIGILLTGFIIYKKTMLTTKTERLGTMKIIDSLQIAPKKMLFVVKVNDRKFLIASGAEHTTFLADLGLEKNMDKIKENVSYIKEKALNKGIQEDTMGTIVKQFEKLKQPKEKQEDEYSNNVVTIRDEQTTIIPRKEMIRKLLSNLKEEDARSRY